MIFNIDFYTKMAIGQVKINGFTNFLNIVKPLSKDFSISIKGDDTTSVIKLSLNDEFITATFNEPFSDEMKDTLLFLYALEK